MQQTKATVTQLEQELKVQKSCRASRQSTRSRKQNFERKRRAIARTNDYSEVGPCCISKQNTHLLEQLTQQKELLEADDTRLRTLQEQLRATTSANGSDLQDKIKLLQSELDTERCEVAKRRTGSLDQHLSLVQEVVACMPDWQPLAQMMTSALESWGELVNSWLNTAALLAQQSIGVQGQETGILHLAFYI